MSSALVDIYAALRARSNLSLHLMDGITAMEGQGPGQGNPREMGLLLASGDGVALDCVASKIMGFDPFKIETIAQAHRSGLGIGDPERIVLLGESWENLPQPGFKPPSTGLQRLAARLLPKSLSGRAFEWLKEARPRPVGDNCRECGLCVEACPMGALTLTGEGIVVSEKDCIECYCCLEHCPWEGLRVPRNLRERIFGFS